MSDLTLASTTSSEAELRHAVSENWRTPPGSPTDAPDDSGREHVVPLDKSDFKDYKRIRDEQVAEKKFEGPEFLKDDKQKPHKKSGWERRIDKLTAVNSRLAAGTGRSAKSKTSGSQAAIARRRLRSKHRRHNRRERNSPPRLLQTKLLRMAMLQARR